MKILYVIVVIFVMLYRFYKSAMKQQESSSQNPKQRSSPKEFDLQEWIQQNVLSNAPDSQSKPSVEYPVETFRRPTSEEIVNELESDRESEIVTELYQYDAANKGRKQNIPVSGINDIPFFETENTSIANASTSLPAVGTINLQNAVIISELLGPPKGMQ